MGWLTITFGLLALGMLGLIVWRTSDTRAEQRTWRDLVQRAGPVDAEFDLSALDGLPEPAQRYFRYTIRPGAPLVSVVEIEMKGQIGLGTREEPRYRPMTARQILAPPEGLVWRVRAGAISGSDGAARDTSWTRFWLFALVPIVWVSGNPDHHHSAFGRVVSEAVFWVPSTLLPSDSVNWAAIDDHTARATVSVGAYSQKIDLSVEADGRPGRVVIDRWSNENADKVFRKQPFGGYLSGFRETNGYRLPMRVEGGNLIGTEDYFPFFHAEVEIIRFPQLTRTRDCG